MSVNNVLSLQNRRDNVKSMVIIIVLSYYIKLLMNDTDIIS